MSMSGCVKSTKGQSSACFVFSPIYWGEGDTEATIDQITLHNAAYEGYCED